MKRLTFTSFQVGTGIDASWKEEYHRRGIKIVGSNGVFHRLAMYAFVLCYNALLGNDVPLPSLKTVLTQSLVQTTQRAFDTASRLPSGSRK
ncbi:MAG: hypothetical protein ABI406_11620 [Ktedonobacteraceae bacterium]